MTGKAEMLGEIKTRLKEIEKRLEELRGHL